MDIIADELGTKQLHYEQCEHENGRSGHDAYGWFIGLFRGSSIADCWKQYVLLSPSSISVAPSCDDGRSAMASRH